MAGGFFERLKAGLSRTAEAVANLLARPMDDQAAEELRERLILGDFGPATADEAVAAAKAAWKSDAGLRKAGPAEAAAAVLEKALGTSGPWAMPTDRKPIVILLLGVNGAGKTTTAAKLVSLWRQQGQRGLLGACDTFRAAAGEQLATWAARLDTEVVGGASGADPAAVAFDAVKAATARGVDFAILDTAGRLHTKAHLLEELRKVVRVVHKALPDAPHEKWLVIDGSLGANSLEQAKVFHEAVGLTGLIVTKLDGSARGGALVAIVRELDVPVRFIGVGEKPEDLQAFDKRAYARSVVGLGE
jgi:fused signal recognition particle receptor